MGLIVYSGANESIICTEGTEAECLRKYFSPGDRDVDDYDREESRNNIVVVTSSLRCDSD
ncbi:hypothetical protein LCGC14_0244090 [marine sediment metagenome]|uniref:Uncharacterized protein n=1 Tax=marine sediment metagenome TaxID=412755 RepID=A0A0F9UMU9_9ZZZZ